MSIAPHNRRVMILGGGKWQQPLARLVRELGYYSMVTDISPEAPARAEANEFVTVDTSNRDALLELARSFAPTLVLADQTDRLVPVVAYLNDALGLPGITPSVALRFTDKFVMREALARTRIALPSYRLVGSVEDACDFARGCRYPVVVKPTSAQSSLGVFRVRDERELRQRYPQTLAVAGEGRILVEEFVQGPEITVEGISVGGRCSVLAISEKAHYEHNPCVAYRLAYPPRYEASLLARIEANARCVVESLGLEDGINHAEYRLRDGKIYLIEVAARGGGNGIASTIVPYVSGVHPYQVLLDALQGDRPHVRPSLACAATLEFFRFPPGRVKAIHGLEALKASRVAAALELSFGVGDRLEASRDDRTRPGYFIVLGENRDETDAKAEEIIRTLRVEYEG